MDAVDGSGKKPASTPETHARKMKKAEQDAASENARVQKKLATDRQQIQNSHAQEVKRMKEEQRGVVNHLRDRNSKELTNEQITHRELIKDQRLMAQKNYHRTAEEKLKLDAMSRQNQRDMQVSGQEAVKQTKQQYQEQVVKEKENFENYRELQRDHFGKEIEKEKDYFSTQMRGMHNNHETRYNENELQYQLILEDQGIRYKDHYDKAKYDFIEKMRKYDKQAADPFYRVQDMGAELNSAGPFYQVAVPVPEQELKNVKVHVQPDRITVSGVKKFEEELNYEGQKVSTNRYQTVKQEFALPTPAEKDLIRREYQDGVLFVTAAKKGFSPIG